VNLNSLLIWMSARGHGSWAQFRSAVEQVHFECPEGQPDEESEGDITAGDLPLYQLLRLNLQRLAHVEFDFCTAGPNWRVVPASLAISEHDGRFLGVLCGARSPDLCRRLNQVSGVDLEIHAASDMPDCIRLVTPDLRALCDAAQFLGAATQVHAPLALLAAIPPVDDPTAWLSAKPPAGPGWTVERFDPQALQWTARRSMQDRNLEPADLTGSQTGLFRFRMKYQRFHFLRWKGRTYKVSVQVGKYAVLRAHRVRGLLRYNSQSAVFSAPVSCRPPLLVERALVLCSGSLPHYAEEFGRLEYSKVPPRVAQLAAALLRQEF
jgi:hypothetical protein